jgi:cyclic pyranopterin phosphate synthase
MTGQSRDDRDAELTHLDAQGRARMVDVSQKAETDREARARAVVELGAALRGRLLAGDLPKGEALGVARLAGIQAAKETARLIPLCHPVPLRGVDVSFRPVGEGGIEVTSEVRCRWVTGVEMEALIAASVAALTIYDMCKAVAKDLRIGPIELLSKSGGRSGDWRRPARD